MKSTKVGDIYYISWGYDQTNCDFYRIKALRGKTQAVIEPVNMKIKSVDGVGFMSGNYAYDTKTATIKDCDVFIEDGKKGKIVRFKEFWDGFTSFKVGDHIAEKYHGQKLYESFYA